MRVLFTLLRRLVAWLFLQVKRAMFIGVLLALPYLAVSFIAWSLNPFDWGWAWRCIATVLTLVVAGFLLSLFLDDAKFLIAGDPAQRRAANAFRDM